MATMHYTQSHEWLLEEDGVITIGITAHAQELLGDVVFVGLPEPGQEISAGEELVVIESVKAAGGIDVPVAGQVIETNERLEDAPELVNEDPMGTAWIVKIRPSEALPGEGLMSEEQYLQSLED